MNDTTKHTNQQRHASYWTADRRLADPDGYNVFKQYRRETQNAWYAKKKNDPAYLERKRAIRQKWGYKSRAPKPVEQPPVKVTVLPYIPPRRGITAAASFKGQY